MKHKINPYLKWGCFTPIAIIISLIIALYLFDKIVPSTARRSLPQSAAGIQEFYSSSWNGDYVRCIKARLTEADLSIYAKKLGINDQFDPIANTDIASTINMGFLDAPAWWTPPLASRTTYFQSKQNSHYLEILKYSEGYVYYVSTSW